MRIREIVKGYARAAVLVAGAFVFGLALHGDHPGQGPFPAFAQGAGNRLSAAGFCSLSSMSAATALSTCSGGIPNGVTYASICAYTQGVVWRDDTVAPTGTPGSGGQGIAANTCLPYNATFTQLQFIQQAAGAVLGISFYR